MRVNLNGRTIVVTRPHGLDERLCELIKAHGGSAISFPTVAFAEPTDTEQYQKNCRLLPYQDWLIFTSPQSTQLRMIVQGGMTEGPRFAAVGEHTAQRLQRLGFKGIIYPKAHYGSEALLSMPEFAPFAINQKKIAIIKGEGGRERLKEELFHRGASVLEVNVYRRILPALLDKSIEHVLTADLIFATACEIIKNLLILIGETHHQRLFTIPLLVISERIKRLAECLGFRRILVTEKITEDALLLAFSDALRTTCK